MYKGKKNLERVLTCVKTLKSNFSKNHTGIKMPDEQIYILQSREECRGRCVWSNVVVDILR